MATHLSPAAQAVLDAVMPLSDEDLLYTYTDKQYAGGMAAAALRAAADRCDPDWLALTVLHHLHSIAAELEAQ